MGVKKKKKNEERSTVMFVQDQEVYSCGAATVGQINIRGKEHDSAGALCQLDQLKALLHAKTNKALALLRSQVCQATVSR
jgi:hypothetical protein